MDVRHSTTKGIVTEEGGRAMMLECKAIAVSECLKVVHRG